MTDDQSTPEASRIRALAERWRATLNAARGNLQVRERVRAIVGDPNRFEAVVRELGPTHAVIRDLREIAAHGEPEPILNGSL